jgi:hypothetical protein
MVQLQYTAVSVDSRRSVCADIDSAASAAVAAAGVSWYLPLVQFDQAVEQRWVMGADGAAWGCCCFVDAWFMHALEFWDGWRRCCWFALCFYHAVAALRGERSCPRLFGSAAASDVLMSVLLLHPCRYISWKHSSLLHLDYGAALFGLLYLAVMLKRLLQEPTTLFYFCVIVIKVLPHVPLMLGFKQQSLRWVFWLLSLCLAGDDSCVAIIGLPHVPLVLGCKQQFPRLCLLCWIVFGWWSGCCHWWWVMGGLAALLLCHSDQGAATCATHVGLQAALPQVRSGCSFAQLVMISSELIQLGCHQGTLVLRHTAVLTAVLMLLRCCYRRHREKWLLLVAPCMALLAFLIPFAFPDLTAVSFLLHLQAP